MSKPIFSVVITTYNYGHFLAECVDSVLAQTLPRDQVEIIVVDDGSTDNTSDIVRPYLREGLIKYILKPNGGHASALNWGYWHSSGKILAFMDADDLWFPEKLQAVKEIYDKYACHAVFHNVGHFSRSGDVLRPYRTEDVLSYWMIRVGSTVFRSHVTVYEKETDFLTILSAQTYSRGLCEKLFPIPDVFIRHTDMYLNYLCYVFSDIYFDMRMLTKYRAHPHSHMTFLRQKREQRYLDLEMQLEGVLIEEVRAKAFPKAPPGLGRVRSLWIWHRVESLVRLGKRMPAVRLLVRSFLGKEMEISLYEVIKRLFWVITQPNVFVFVHWCYANLGLSRLRLWVSKHRQARGQEAARRRVNDIGGKERRLSA